MVFGSVCFVSDDGIGVDVFDAFEDVAFDVRVGLFHLGDEVFDFHTF